MYLCNLVTRTAHQFGVIIHHYEGRVEFSYTSVKAALYYCFFTVCFKALPFIQLLIKTSNIVIFGSSLLRETLYSRATVTSNITAE